MDEYTNNNGYNEVAAQAVNEPSQDPTQPHQDYTYTQPQNDFQQAQYTYEQPQYNQQGYYDNSQQTYYGDGRLQSGSKEKLVAGILGILLGSFGVHKFYLGYNKAGVIMLLVTLLTFGIGAFIMQVIGIVEGVLYLTKTDEEFDRLYVTGKSKIGRASCRERV